MNNHICWKYKRRSILFKYKDDVIPWLISCIELDQVGMVQIIHDLDLILHHLLPKTQAQTHRQTDAEADKHTQRQAVARTHTHTHTHTDIHGHDERCQLFSAMRQCIFSSRSNISHLGEKYSLCFCSKRPCHVLVRTKTRMWAPAFYIMRCGSHCSIKKIGLIRYRDTRHEALAYLFLQTPGFDDLRRQSETWRVFDTFVHLAKTTPWREKKKVSLHFS